MPDISNMIKMAQDTSDSDEPKIDDNVIRIQLRKSEHKKWELRTRNLSPGTKFPIIQLFDADGNILLETNDDDISIKSSELEDRTLRTTQSLREKDFRHFIHKTSIKKHNTISGDKIYTRIYRTPVITNESSNYHKTQSLIRDSNSVTNIPKNLIVSNDYTNLKPDSLQTSPFQSDGLSEISSYKSSDNENSFIEQDESENNNIIRTNEINEPKPHFTLHVPKTNTKLPTKDNTVGERLEKSQSFNIVTENLTKNESEVCRSQSGTLCDFPQNKVSFLTTYLKRLQSRTTPSPNWHKLGLKKKEEQIESKNAIGNNDKTGDMPTENVLFGDKNTEHTTTDLEADYEIKRRLRMYRRELSEIESSRVMPDVLTIPRRHSVIETMGLIHTSSSESIDEADIVLNRLKRRVIKNGFREKRRCQGAKYQYDQTYRKREELTSEGWYDDGRGASRFESRLSSCHSMGSNISQHSSKGLKGRRARSSGDLCNGETKSQTESSVCGSVVGDVMGWNRSLPNHLDGNRHLADYSRVNNNYGELGSYSRCHPKGGRGLRYRVSKSGSGAEPVWKLQDPGFDQGYGSERSPEDDYIPAIVPPISLENYEAELRTVYPFITEENTFTVVVEKDGRGLGMSVCGGGGLVRIRRLYPPQPAWRTGRLAPRDLLLSANSVPLAGLSTYEALEVLRTASARVELRVCRPPPDVLESVTPPEPPTPPARTPHPPHLPPLDPLNCHPMHARLSQTTSSATTSSTESRGRRETSPEADRRELHLPDLDRPLPVYDIQYGEFDIVMIKVNGSLGFTLRKEDHSALGHYVRALVREPALSDGRIQPGDRIVAVNDTPMSNMSHAEAVAFLRACGSEVRLRLYRDHAATPLSPTSPKEDGPTDSDAPLNKPKPPLRPEAVSMLCDLAARRLTPDAVDGSCSPCLSPRKLRKLTKENNHYEQPNETHNRDNSKSIEQGASREPRRIQTVTLASPTVQFSCRTQKLSLAVSPHVYELNNFDSQQTCNIYQDEGHRYMEPVFPIDSDEPVSMPVEVLNDEARFKHSSPAYQSAVLLANTSDGSSEGQKDDKNGLKKWKGVALSPDNERKMKIESLPQNKNNEIDAVQKENVKPGTQTENTNTEPTIMTVELNRGWNSRLGFSVQSHPESGQSYISAVYNDSVAARDGRLRRGDVILQVNDENVTSMKTPEVIDLLRILRGSICITVLRPPNSQ